MDTEGLGITFYVLRARRIMSPADILITHAFWAPILFPRQEYGVQYIHVGRYPKGQLLLYKKAARLQVPSKAIEEACKQEASSMSSKIKTFTLSSYMGCTSRSRF